MAVEKVLPAERRGLKRKQTFFFILTNPNFSVPSCLIKWFRENRIRLQQRRAAKRKAQQQLDEEGNDVDDGGNDCGQTSLTLHSTASTTLQRCAHYIATHCLLGQLKKMGHIPGFFSTKPKKTQTNSSSSSLLNYGLSA